MICISFLDIVLFQTRPIRLTWQQFHLTHEQQRTVIVSGAVDFSYSLLSRHIECNKLFCEFYGRCWKINSRWLKLRVSFSLNTVNANNITVICNNVRVSICVCFFFRPCRTQTMWLQSETLWPTTARCSVFTKATSSGCRLWTGWRRVRHCGTCSRNPVILWVNQ